MKPRTHKRLLKAWPALCGLATFGIFAAVSFFVMPSGSWAMPALFGGLAWAASYAMLHAESGEVAMSGANKSGDDWDWDLVNNPAYSHLAANIHHDHRDD